MVSSVFNLEKSRLKREVQIRKAKLVFIQVPDGLKPHVQILASTVEKAGALAIISADPCYGACDLAIAEAESLGADLVVHYGHSEMLDQAVPPTLYIEAKEKKNVDVAVRRGLLHLAQWTKIGLVTTVQHVDKLDDVKKLLLAAGKTVVTGDAGKTKYAGQILGCNYSNAKAVSKEVDAFLFIGGGKFHALGLALATAKPIIVADPYQNKAFSIGGNARAAILKKRWANIQEATKSESIGILIGLKPGQKKIATALEMKTLVENAGKKAVLLALREITPEALMQFPTIEAFINTACPRLSLDDGRRFRKPLVTVTEMLVALGKTKWEELCKTGWFES